MGDGGRGLGGRLDLRVWKGWEEGKKGKTGPGGRSEGGNGWGKPQAVQLINLSPREKESDARRCRLNLGTCSHRPVQNFDSTQPARLLACLTSIYTPPPASKSIPKISSPVPFPGFYPLSLPHPHNPELRCLPLIDCNWTFLQYRRRTMLRPRYQPSTYLIIIGSVYRWREENCRYDFKMQATPRDYSDLYESSYIIVITLHS